VKFPPRPSAYLDKYLADKSLSLISTQEEYNKKVKDGICFADLVTKQKSANMVNICCKQAIKRSILSPVQRNVLQNRKIRSNWL
jgi:hypothetical protein